jgi:hypothetical protein
LFSAITKEPRSTIQYKTKMLFIRFFQDNLLNRIEGQEQELAATQEEEVGKLEVCVGVGVPVVKGGGVGA